MVSFKLPAPYTEYQLTTPENTLTYHNALFFCHSKILHKNCLWFLLEVKMASRETTENFGVTNKERYGMFCFFSLEWSVEF